MVYSYTGLHVGAWQLEVHCSDRVGPAICRLTYHDMEKEKKKKNRHVSELRLSSRWFRLEYG